MFPLDQRQFVRRKKKSLGGPEEMRQRAFQYKNNCMLCEERELTCVSAHKQHLSSSFKSLQEEERLCDITLCAGDGFSIKIHSFLISNISPVLANLLKNEKNTEITVADISGDILKLFVNFVYTGNVDLTDENVKGVLSFANKYLINRLIVQCEGFMEKQLSISNCVRSLHVAKCYNLALLQFHARLFILWNWTLVWQNCDDFESLLNAQDLFSLLEDDRLNVSREDKLKESIMKWINYDIRERDHYLPKLLSTVRIDLNNRSFSLRKSRKKELNQQMSAKKYRSRVPRRLLFTIGGWCSGAATKHVEVFDNKANLWILSPLTDNVSRSYHGTAVVCGAIYLIGGYDGYQCFRSVRSFTPGMRAWMEQNSMNEARCYVSAVVLNEEIYAIGGFDGDDRKSSCERFNSKTNQWTMIQPMLRVRSDASAASYHRKIYVCGGYDGEDILFSSEIYNPETDQWTMFDPMPDPRSGHKLLVYKHSLYLIGGYNGDRRLRTMYRYSQLHEGWIQDASLNESRSNFGAVIFENQIYVIGGFDGCAIIPSVECYDVENRCWQHAPELNIARSALCACVIEDLPNAILYSANGPYGKMTLAEYNRHA